MSTRHSVLLGRGAQVLGGQSRHRVWGSEYGMVEHSIMFITSRMLSWVQKMTLPGQQSVWIWKFQFEFGFQADLKYLY